MKTIGKQQLMIQDESAQQMSCQEAQTLRRSNTAAHMFSALGSLSHFTPKITRCPRVQRGRRYLERELWKVCLFRERGGMRGCVGREQKTQPANLVWRYHLLKSLSGGSGCSFVLGAHLTSLPLCFVNNSPTPQELPPFCGSILPENL